MNERMIELYKEASEFAYTICREEGRAGGASDHIWNTLSTGKFAELIVKECMLRVRSRQQFATEDEQNVTQAFDLLIYDLESLFGVEE